MTDDYRKGKKKKRIKEDRENKKGKRMYISVNFHVT